MKPTTELWENALSVIENTLTGRDFGTWIENRLSLLRYDRTVGILYLGVDTDFLKAHLENKYLGVIESAATEAFGTALRIQFLLPEEWDAMKKKEERPGLKDKRAPSASSMFELERIFNPRYTFDNFIIGDNSRFAAGAAQAVAQAPGMAYSPLFIYGGSGLGKTHLMNAIGIYILENFPEHEVLYVSSETFTDEFVNASIHKKMDIFKEKYRGVDVLLIDDIQFISEKEKTIEEVFNTFNALYDSGKQMVFTADCPPKDILGLDERLKGRLASGLLVDLQPPSYEIKVAILKNKAVLNGVEIDEGLSEVISFIAENIKSNVRDLEGAFNRVVAYAKLVGRDFSKGLAKEVLKDIVMLSGNEPSAKDIKKVVAGYFGITVASIDSEERTRSLSIPRQIAMYLSRELTGLSFPKIAKTFKKDYATVHYAYYKIKEEIAGNENLKNIVNELTEKIQNEY